VPELTFAATVSLSLDSAQSSGETPDGVRLELRVHGAVDGPMLSGSFPPLSAYMLVDVDGIGTLYVRAPVQLKDGAVLEIEATVRYDFGQDGYRRAATNDLPDSEVAGCLRFLTGDPRYQWVNRAVCLGVGALRASLKRIDYDLYVISPATTGGAMGATDQGSLYERLGGREGISKIVDDFVEGLDTNLLLNRQNPRISRAAAHANPDDRRKKVVDYVCKLTGGPCEYTGRPLKQAHAPIHITDADWAIGGQLLLNALNKNNVREQEQIELFEIMDRLKPEIVQGA
jgi:hemoglobin